MLAAIALNDAASRAISAAPPVGARAERSPVASRCDEASTRRIEVAIERAKPEHAQARFEADCRRNPVHVAAPDLVRAKRDVAGGFRGEPATVKKGSVLPADDPFVLEHSGAWEPVAIGRK